ncbi:MAG: glycoside hydrolase family 88 protein [Candidatus Marinimicrobia bacterium]|nr:glycoside hydrolase family 88 protein [Candidatus Neomarinimicrobiota bacterium]
MKIFKSRILFLILFVILVQCNNDNKKLVDQNFRYAQNNYKKMVESFPNARQFPRSLRQNGELVRVESHDWTSGFFPGSLWYIYEYTQNDSWKNYAEKFTAELEREKNNDGTHDIGFMMFNSFGNGYRLTGHKEYKKILLTSAKTLATRFNPQVGCIRSWDWNSDEWKFPVIIDNMMNLELLFWATKVTGDSTYYKMAVSHANHTIKNHFRADNSSFHVVDYDPTNGEVRGKQTWQGFANSSAWSRGQAWGLYGFTMAYRYTKNHKYLSQAQKIAEFTLDHKNMPEDMIPYWDYNAPNIPNEPRDASAAAIMASALYELHTFVKDKNYRKYADRILANLSSEQYKANQSNFLINHCVGSRPENSEVDVPLIYADYYFLEANLRKQRMK